MTSSSDQNLLFGIIALQMDFVRRDQLVAATSTWLTDKSRRVDDILVEQGALSEEDRQLLAPLVARHLENHGGDPGQSLAALSSIGSVAEELRALGDENIEATLSMVASDRPDDMHAETAIHESKGSTTASAPTSAATDARFRILRSHARGGLGEVYVAKDTELNREVALKEIQTKYAGDENSRLRFLLEAEVTGGLEHPGIVPVYGLGRYEDGRPFYAMRFIKGDSLQEAADRFHRRIESGSETGDDENANGPDFNSLEFRKLLGRFIDVCQAIEYAHSRGVLHRDLKPGNIMLGKYGETLVVDWGLAKAQGRDEADKVEGETTLRPASASGSAPTMMGSAIGTPSFMPPEQAAGELDQLGPASDVYSLGATLYYLLTGLAPITGKDLASVLRDVQSGEFPTPCSVSAAPKPLEAVCLKAMSLRPDDRYRSPQQLADDIERYLADEPVSAFREPFVVRLRRWMRRHQTAVSSIAAGLLVALAASSMLAVVVSRNNRELAEANDRETDARELAQSNEREANLQRNLAIAANKDLQEQVRVANAERLAALSQSVRREFPVQSLLLGVAAVEKTRLHDLGVLPQARQALFDSLGNIGGRPFSQPAKVFDNDISQDGHWLATVGGDGTVRLWDLQQADPASAPRLLGRHASLAHAARFSPDGRLLATSSSDKTVRLWDLNSTDPSQAPIVLPAGDTSFVDELVFSADNRWLVTAGNAQTPRLWDLEADDPAASARQLEGARLDNALAFSPNSRYLATGHHDGVVQVWNLSEEDQALAAQTLTEKGAGIRSLMISPNGRWLIATSGKGTVRRWDLSQDQIAPTVARLPGHTAFVHDMEVTRDSRWLFTAGHDATVRVWDLTSDDPIASSQVLTQHQGAVVDLALSPDERWLGSSDWTGTIRIWDLADIEIKPAKSAFILRGHRDIVNSIVFSPDGRWLISGSYDNTARLWEMGASDPAASSRVLLGHEGTINALNISPNSKWLVTQAFDGVPRLWGLDKPDPTGSVPLLHPHQDRVLAVGASPDNRWLATASADGSIRLHELRADGVATSPTLLQEHTGEVSCLEFSSDSKLMATAGADKTIRVWRLSEAVVEATFVLRGHQDKVRSIAISPDGHWLVSGSDDNTARLWDLTTSDPAASSVELEGHNAPVNDVVVSADNHWLVTASRDGTAQLWDLTSSAIPGSPRVLKAHNRAIESAGITSDNHWLVTSGGFETYLWDLTADDPTVTATKLGSGGKCLVISPDNRWLATSTGQLIRLWDMNADSPAESQSLLLGHEKNVQFLVASPNSRWLISGSWDGTVRLWDLSSSEVTSSSVVLKSHTDSVRCLAVSPDGRWLATGSSDKTLRVWPLDDKLLLETARLKAGRELSGIERKKYSVDDDAESNN